MTRPELLGRTWAERLGVNGISKQEAAERLLASLPSCVLLKWRRGRAAGATWFFSGGYMLVHLPDDPEGQVHESAHVLEHVGLGRWMADQGCYAAPIQIMKEEWFANSFAAAYLAGTE